MQRLSSLSYFAGPWTNHLKSVTSNYAELIRTIFAVIFLVLSVRPAAAADQKILLEEKFQGGFSPEWAEVSKGIEIVPQDPAKPDGPFAARFTGPGQMIAGPWVKPRDWKSAAKKQEQLETWDDYKLSFRFRVGNIPDVPMDVRGQTFGLFDVAWRVNPAEENPNESYVMPIRFSRNKKEWALMGPLVIWDGQDLPPDSRDEMGPAGGAADTQWHTFEVTVQGDTMSTMLDKEFHMRVRDSRITAGVIAIRSAWTDKLGPGYVDVADIQVERLGETGDALTAEQRRLQALSRGCLIAYLPARGELRATMDFSRGIVRDRKVVTEAKGFQKATVRVKPQSGGKVLAEATFEKQGEKWPEQTLKLPPLEGEYVVEFTFEGSGKPVTAERPLERKHFPWEGNELGITDEIYPPFLPVRTDGDRVDVVLRSYVMNEFGLWKSAKSMDHEILAAPIALRYETKTGEGKWEKGTVSLVKSSPAMAQYESKVGSPAVNVACQSTVEFDGCMKVDMTLSPGSEPMEIQKMWIDIPLKESEARLLHPFVDLIRLNYAGNMPKGEGSIWDSRKAERMDRIGWLNSFCSYIWMGSEERGLAWFAENDRGWYTAKDNGKAAVQEIIRENGRVTLRVYLVNTPSTISKETHLVFGLQASPVKPMVDDWRGAKSDQINSISGPVVPWGGLSCAYKGPYNGDWEVIDKISEAQKTGVIDEAWFDNYVKEKNPPPVFGTKPWKESVLNFIKKWGVPRTPRPALVYADEMAACTVQPPWQTFQDEWAIHQEFTQRPKRTDEVFRSGPSEVSARSNFAKSYQDYALWYHNEWLKRGVSLYWDNCQPTRSTNLAMSGAYLAEDGRVQPGLVLWNQREYSKRTWNLLNYWRRNQSDPLEFSMHRTNCQLLPLHGWATVSLDLEWSARYDKPFPPDEIRTTVTGLQTGVIGTDHRGLFGKVNKVLLKQAETRKDWPGRVSWGMRTVHELGKRSQVTPGFAPEATEAAEKLEKTIEEFGYGQPGQEVFNYWAAKPVLDAGNDKVKWLAISQPENQSVLVVLQSWDVSPVSLGIKLDPEVLGFKPGVSATDAETGERVDLSSIEIPGVYGTRVVRLQPK